MKNMHYAPIIITTLCRAEHFKNCIESLAQCSGADQTDLYIGLDYPSKEEHWEGYKKIKEFIPSITGFKQIYTFEHKENLGSQKNEYFLVEKVRLNHESFIYVEDDILVAPNFLKYINSCLYRYKNASNIIAICGYNYRFLSPPPTYPANIYPAKSFCAWGVGYWIDKYAYMQENYSNYEMVQKTIYSWKSAREIFRHKRHIQLHRLLQRGKTGYFDLMWRIGLKKENKYCIFPSISKVRNTGFDGTGVNCSKNEDIQEQEIDTLADFTPDEIDIRSYEEIEQLYNKYNGGRWMVRIACIIEYIGYRLGLGAFLSKQTQISKFRKKIVQEPENKVKSK